MKKLIILLAFLFLSLGHTNSIPTILDKSCETIHQTLKNAVNNIAYRFGQNQREEALFYAEQDYKFAIIYQAMCKE